MASKQVLFCQACGQKFMTDFKFWDGRVCGRSCWDHLQLVRAHSTLDHPPLLFSGNVNKPEETNADRK